jgi:hypothetical protein
MLEYWKNGFGILNCWVNSINRLDDIIKMGNILSKTTIPSFHHFDNDSGLKKSLVFFPPQRDKNSRRSIIG